MKSTLLLTSVLACVAGAQGFKLRLSDDGQCQIVEDGQVVIERVEPTVGEPFPGRLIRELKQVDGMTVYNVWSEEKDCRYRQEVAVPEDGSRVEITFACSGEAYTERPLCGVSVELPYSLIENASFEGLYGNSRKWLKMDSTFTSENMERIEKEQWRFMALKGSPLGEVIFDFHPRGAGDENAMYRAGVVRGVWKVERKGGMLVLKANTDFGERGGTFHAKMVLRRGVFEDYDTLHAMKSFTYKSRVTPERRLSFGAVKKGASYEPADCKAFDAASGYGWVSDTGTLSVATSGDGVFYSSVNGHDGKFQCSALKPGLYIVTFNCGNTSETEKGFDIRSKNKTIVQGLTVKSWELVTVTTALWIEDGMELFSFDGDFCISCIVLHRLMASAEDYTFRRGFWVVDGYEPACLYMNMDTHGEANLKTAIDRTPLPVPGAEEKGRPKPFTFITPETKSNADWRFHASIANMGSNDASLFEYGDHARLGRFLDIQEKRAVNTIMMSGMHSRHTYPRQRPRVMEYVRTISTEMHKRGMHLIDHHDALLLWNDGAGFRAFAERLGETVLEPAGRMPSFDFCIMNPTFTEKCQDYLCELVANGVDALLVDEIYFADIGCRCSHCLESFRQDTGWQLPLNELDPRLDNPKSEMWRLWCDWRKKKVGDWWVKCRDRLAKVNPDVVLLTYSSDLVRDYASNRQGISITNLGRAFDFFGSEVMTQNPYKSARTFPSMRKSFLQLSLEYGAPIFCFIYASNWHSLKYGWAACRFAAQQPLALGANAVMPEGERDFWNYVSPMPDNASQVAEVALLFSAPSRDWATQVSFHKELYGIAQTLEEMHVAYEFIGEMSLRRERLAKYKVLFLANSICLSDEQAAAIKEFAAQGGVVHFGPTAGWFDEHGSTRSWPFAEIFGFSPKYRSDKVVSLSWEDGAILPIKTVPSPLWCVDGTLGDAAFGLYANYANGKRMPVLVERPCGKGRMICQLMALHQTLFQAEQNQTSNYDFIYDRPLAEVCHGILGSLVEGHRCIETDAPEKVQMNLFTAGGRFYIHLINATGVNPTPGEAIGNEVPDEPWPALGRDISLTIKASDAVRAWASSSDFDGRVALALSKTKDGRVTVTLPATLLKCYTVIVID